LNPSTLQDEWQRVNQQSMQKPFNSPMLFASVASSSPASGDVIADIQIAGLNFVESDKRNKHQFRGALCFDEKPDDHPLFDLRNKEVAILSPLVNKQDLGGASQIGLTRMEAER
jgi:hypothetical protein